MSDTVVLVIDAGTPHALWVRYKLNNGYKSPAEALREAMTLLFDYAVAKDLINPVNPNFSFRCLDGTESQRPTRESSSE